jgi:hypothetical protein
VQVPKETSHARVAEYRGTDPAALEAVLGAVLAEVEADLAEPPEGLEGLREVILLADRQSGRALAITLFADEEALRRGSAVLDRRSLSQSGGVRVDVAGYAVAMRADGP